MKVKICGVTTVADALMCAEAGADLIGLNFYRQGKRYVSPAAAREIAAALRALPRPPALVGVFVNETAAFMAAVLDECGLDFAQLSGDEPEEVLQAMSNRAFKGLRDLTHASRFTNHVSRLAPHTSPPNRPDFLLDAHVPGEYGGTGRTADWGAATEAARQWRVLLAGGLTPVNVAEAVRQVKPWGVDVASGVEHSPRAKDAAKVRSFIQAAHAHHE